MILNDAENPAALGVCEIEPSAAKVTAIVTPLKSTLKLPFCAAALIDWPVNFVVATARFEIPKRLAAVEFPVTALSETSVIAEAFSEPPPIMLR